LAERNPSKNRSLERAVKKAFERSAALIALVVLSPILGAVAAWIALSIGRPVLFVQTRPGLGGRPFRLVKFRTMCDARSPDGQLLPDAVRLTRVGRILRATSLDELPQLWNVVRGELALVGPRPLLMQYLERYTPRQARRHEVRPGITGWAQVNGRNAISWEERLELDVWYVDHWSLLLDFKILALTVGRLSRPSGISHDGHATMPEFLGSDRAKSGVP
jgi:lipopolysaccharide/colanic/teichoic acid biosynthesis glycosyltransferase